MVNFPSILCHLNNLDDSFKLDKLSETKLLWYFTAQSQSLGSVRILCNDHFIFVGT